MTFSILALNGPGARSDLATFCWAHGLGFEERNVGEQDQDTGGDTWQHRPGQYTITMGGVCEGKMGGWAHSSLAMGRGGVGEPTPLIGVDEAVGLAVEGGEVGGGEGEKEGRAVDSNTGVQIHHLGGRKEAGEMASSSLVGGPNVTEIPREVDQGGVEDGMGRQLLGKDGRSLVHPSLLSSLS